MDKDMGNVSVGDPHEEGVGRGGRVAVNPRMAAASLKCRPRFLSKPLFLSTLLPERVS